MYYAALVIDEGSAAGDIIRFAVPLSFIKGSIAQLRLILLSVLLFVLTTAAILSLRFSRSLVNPIEEIGSVARFISSGNFDRKVLFKSGDELGVLAQTINDMGQTLKEKVWQISQEKSKLETVMSAMTSGVILCNGRGNLDFINDAAEKIFGVNRENVVGLSLQAALRNFLLHENLQEVLKTGDLKSFELNLFVPDTRVLQVHMVAVRGHSAKEVMGALTVLYDITGLRSLERMRSEFVANVSHELRTPLTVIKGYAETLLDETNWEKPVVVRNILTIIDKEAERLARLLKDLLDLSRIESSKSIMKKQELNIVQVLMDARSLLESPATDKAINVSIHHPQEDLNLIQGDP
ncbi:MAG: histidine kinase dimerization/phospho-acceptor domain-containing protein, partial [Bacillota bacterium]|nr:histidine kinase dimerization/phospho-acceptor domain-containing protein [Bacillota bacterium]